MPIFKISKGGLAPIKTASFENEKEIQSITEANLEIIFGLSFVCSEFSTGRFRIDTIGFDPETKAFVIIEYKKDQNFSVIDQGYAYLSLMLNHKADFVLLYNENTGVARSKNNFDWSQSRVIFVSPSFTAYQMEAINFKDLPIELWEIHLYSNDIIRYNKVKPQQVTASIRSISKANRDINKVTSEIEIFTEEKILDGVDEEIREAYLTIKHIIYQINGDVEERIKKTMICYYADGKGLVWVKPTKRSITLWLRKGRYKDKDGNIIPEGWGDYPELRLSAKEIDAIYLRGLIEQANRY